MTNRRLFIKQSALGAAALATSASAWPNMLLKKKKDKIGVALMGLGYYSTDLLAPALQLTQHCQLTGIVTGTPEKALRWQAKHKIADRNIYNYENFDRIADNPDIDVVYVVLPPFLHKEFTVRAAEAGKHVWCEKPMAMTAAECQAMVDACKKNKVKLTVGYRMQHEPNTQEIIRFGREKTFGAVKFLTASAGFRAGWQNWTDHWKMEREKGGGAMYDMGVYSLNAARYAIGEEPIAVVAQERTDEPERFAKADETTLFQLEFPSGALANCMTSLGININTLEVTAEQGWYRLQPFQAYNNVRGITSKGNALDQYIENQQARQMDDDALAILNDTAVLVPGEEGWRDIKMVEAIQLSAREGRRVLI
ncbi:MAG TPA: Gfo/Idh/MocA family oxidoreductase [Saprospiraceae bacterium]|nr:Gfo/Idh/MocA family oxidoreductase [Saprospiraceae bacterium]HMQ81627.1 Gfo/Idh/MocA family oxidoreductase [Saprospiraceae bacterium]